MNESQDNNPLSSLITVYIAMPHESRNATQRCNKNNYKTRTGKGEGRQQKTAKNLF